MSVDHPIDERLLIYRNASEKDFVEGTRIILHQGINFLSWVHYMHELFAGELIPVEWAPDYVRVTRAAVHKRIKKGQLSVLEYQLEERVPSAFSTRTRARMRNRYRYVFASECDIWRLNSLQITEQADVNTLGSPYIEGWWIEAMDPKKPKLGTVYEFTG